MTTDNYSALDALSSYYQSRESNRPARLWSIEKLVHDLAALGVVGFFEGPGTDPTTLTGYASDKLWLQQSSGVQAESGVIRVWDGGGPASNIANWPALTPALFGSYIIEQSGAIDGAGDLSSYTPEGEDALQRTIRSRLRDVASVKDFGAVGDGVADDYVALQNAIDSLDDTIGGTLFIPEGIYLTSAPLVINKPSVALLGAGSGGNHTGGIGCTDIRGTATTGPVIRAKRHGLRMESFIVSATSARTNATMITKASGGNRDDQNYGIWIEPDDTSSSLGATQITQMNFLRDVWITSQPNTNLVISVGGYSSVIDRCASVLSKGHGCMINAGAYTGRTNVSVPGVMEVRSWIGIANAGHGFACGTPDDAAGPSAVRVIVDNLDIYNNGTNASLLYEPYAMYFICDNALISNSAMNGNSTIGALYVHGRNIDIKNLRLINMPSGPAPIKVGAEHGAALRITQGVDIDTLTCPQGSHTNLVEVESGALNVSVRVKALDGTFSGLASAAQVYDRAGVRVWDGSLSIPLLLSGKITNDDTNSGVRIDGDNGYLSVVRDGNVPHVLNRLSSSGVISILRKDSTNVSLTGVSIVTGVSTTPVTIYALGGTSAGLVQVTGAYDDAGTKRRFCDILMCFTSVTPPTVVASAGSNSPAARTYSMSVSNLSLTMASGTYDIRASGSPVTFAT